MSELVVSEAPVIEPVAGSEPAPAAEPVAEPVAAVPVDDEATLDAALEEQAIHIPVEGKAAEVWVPVGALAKLRKELREVKGDASRAHDLEQQLAEYQGNYAQQQPIIQAAEALLAAHRHQQQQPTQPTGPDPAYVAHLQEIAKDLDLFDANGKPDLDRAHRIHMREVSAARGQAEVVAQQMVAPLAERALRADAARLKSIAKTTTVPGTEIKADPQIIDAVWAEFERQQGGLEKLANPDAVLHLWNYALGLSHTKANMTTTPRSAVAAPTTPPTFTERSGGAPRAASVALSPMEAKAAKDMGMTEAEYRKAAGTMPW